MDRKIGLMVVLAFAATALSFPSTALAQDYPSLSAPPQVEQTGAEDVAVIVGIGDYFVLQDVDGVTETVNDWETFFVQGLGIPATRVHTLVDQRATRERMEDFAGRAAEDVGEGGNLWFVFVGHGAPTSEGDDGVLVGVDAQSEPSSLEARGLKRSDLVDTLEGGEQAQTLVFLDTCFSGRADEGEALAEGMQPVVPDRADEEFEPESSTLVMAAAQSDEFAGALPGKQRPAFSYVTLGALRGWAAGDEEVTASEAISYVRRHLRQLDHSQTPDITGDAEATLVRGASEEDPGLAEVMQAALRGSGAKEVEEFGERSGDTNVLVCDHAEVRDTPKWQARKRQLAEQFEDYQKELDRRQNEVLEKREQFESGALPERKYQSAMEELQGYYQRAQESIDRAEEEAKEEMTAQTGKRLASRINRENTSHILAESAVLFAADAVRCISKLENDESLSANAQTIGIVDFHQVLESSSRAKEVKRKLEREFEKRQQRLDDEQQRVMQFRERLERKMQRQELSQEERQAKTAQLQREMSELQELYVDLQDELKAREAEVTEALYSEMVEIVEEFAAVHELDLIYGKGDIDDHEVYWRSPYAPATPPGVDVTEEVIELLDQ